MKRLEGYFPMGAELRPGVEVAYYGRHPTSIDFGAQGLDRASNDDVLVAAALQYREENPGVEVALVSQDTGPKLTALDHGISVLALSEELRLPAEPDPLTRENDELRRQVLKLQSARPELRLEFVNSDQPELLEVLIQSPLPYPQDQLEADMAKVRAKYPRMTGETATMHVAHQEYDQDIERYLAQYEVFLKAKRDHDNLARRTAVVLIKLVNTGSQPADDVDIDLHFPNGFLLFDTAHQRQAPKEPAPPVRPRTLSDMVSASLAAAIPRPLDLYIPTLRAIGGNVSSLTIKQTKSYDVSAHVKRLKHGNEEELPEAHIEFESDQARSFAIDYAIRPANLPTGVSGQLHVHVKVRHEVG